MDLTQVLALIVGANTIITFVTTVYNLMSTRATKALKAIESLEQKIGEQIALRQEHSDAIVGRFQLVEDRLLKIEADMEHFPDREQAHKLELAIEKLSGGFATLEQRLTGRLDTLDERLKPVAATSARIQNLLMERGAKD